MSQGHAQLLTTSFNEVIAEESQYTRYAIKLVHYEAHLSSLIRTKQSRERYFCSRGGEAVSSHRTPRGVKKTIDRTPLTATVE